MSKLLVANWKMNPLSEAEAVRLAKASDQRGVIVCPPFLFLSQVKNALKKASLGAQDVFWENPSAGGAYTGEVSPTMLKKIGVRYVIVGHSERRRHLKETDEMVNKKVRTALKAGLKVVLCVGEPLQIRKRGLPAAKRFVKDQLSKNLRNVSSIKYQVSRLTVAYEPIWAIGTGKPDNPSETAEMSAFIKNFLMAKPYTLNPKVLYGGSVTSSNVARIFEYQEINGALVGGASLKPEEFKKIIKLTQKIN